MESLVSTKWLAAALAGPTHRPQVIDASRHLPDAGRDAHAEFAAGHIPGARFFDTGLPATKIGAEIAALGLTPDRPVVVYDHSDLHSAARGWFLLTLHGFSEVAVLDGGLPKWRAEGRPQASGSNAEATATAAPAADLTRMRSRDDVLAALGHAGQLVDARGPARFAGTSPEPRPGLAAGHIPGARNLPYAAFYAADGTFQPPEKLRAAFATAGIDPAQPFTASCGSGVTACSVLFAAHVLGHNEGVLYEAGWAEWGADPALPKATGPKAGAA